MVGKILMLLILCIAKFCGYKYHRGNDGGQRNQHLGRNQTALCWGTRFSHKWNMGWMNDFLRYMSMDSIYENTIEPYNLFYDVCVLENFLRFSPTMVHGKCSAIGKMPGLLAKFAGLRAS